MKNIFASALTALTALTILAAGSAFAASPVPNEVFYNAKFQLSEITVVNDGVQTTYDVPAELAAQGSFTSKGKEVSFGLVRSGCAPYIGDTVSEMKVNVTDVSGVHTTSMSSEEAPTISHMRAAKSGIVTIPAGSKVYGTCGTGTKSLIELSIYAKDKATISFELN